MLSHFSGVWLFATAWTAAHQTSRSLESPGKNTGVGSHAILQRIFLTQGSNPVSYVSCICKQVLYHQRCSPVHQYYKFINIPLGSPI